MYAGGGIGMVYGSFHKSLKTLFDWPETLTLSCELLKLGCDWLFKSQTTAKTTDNRIYREASPRKSLCLFLFRRQIVYSLRREIINYGLRRSCLPEGGLFSVRCWLGFQGNQLTFGPGHTQVHRECVDTR